MKSDKYISRIAWFLKNLFVLGTYLLYRDQIRNESLPDSDNEDKTKPAIYLYFAYKKG